MTRRTDARPSGRGCARRLAAGARSRLIAPLCLCLLLAPGAARAAAPGSRWASMSLLAGSTQPVAGMADYQWDVRPHAAWGAQFLAGQGPVAAGMRWWRGGTTQSTGLAGVTNPAVRVGSIEFVVRSRVARWRAAQLMTTASGGRMAITYRPDRLTIAAGGTPVVVALDAVHEWVGGIGAAVQLPLADGWTLGLETERRMYSLDTAHRTGSTVALSREAFGDWDARFAVARTWDW